MEMMIMYFDKSILGLAVVLGGCAIVSVEPCESDECEVVADESESATSETESAGSTSGTVVMDCDPSCEESEICHEGICVDCTPDNDDACRSTAEWCNPTSFSCEQCTNHFQCPGNAGCNLETNACLPSNRVFRVPSDGLSLDDALKQIGVENGTIRIDGGSLHIIDSFSLKDGQVLAVVAAPHGDRPTIQVTDMLDEVEFPFNVDDGQLFLRSVAFSGEAGVRVTSTAATNLLHAEKVAFNNLHIAADIKGGRAKLRSCMLISTTPLNWPTLLVDNSGWADVKFSTILAYPEGTAVSCWGTGEIYISNSIVGTTDDNSHGLDLANSCTSSIRHSVAEDDMIFDVEESVEIIPLEGSHFSAFEDGDLHLVPTLYDFQSVAEWSVGDPCDDFDGNRRTSDADSLFWPGADDPD